MLKAIKISLIIALNLLSATPFYGMVRVVCTSGEDQNVFVFVIDPSQVLIILPQSTSFLLHYENCFPKIPASPPSAIHRCSRNGESFEDYIEYDANDLTFLNFITVVEGNDIDSNGMKIICAKTVEDSVIRELY